MQEEDLSFTHELAEHFGLLEGQGSHEWWARLFDLAFRAPMATTEEQCFRGPDGLTYFALVFPKQYEPFAPFTIENSLEYLIEHHLGVAIFANSETPVWVFTHGDVLTWKLHGRWVVPWEEPRDGVEVTVTEERVMVGAPNEEMFPN